MAGLRLTRRAERTDRRAALVLFGVWAVAHIAVFSSQQGIFHPYYVSALAPAVAALAGIGLVLLVGWARRSWAGLIALYAGIAVTVWLAVALLGRTSSFDPALRVLIPVAGVIAVTISPFVLRPGGRIGARRIRLMAGVAGVAAGIALVAGPAAYSFANLGRSLSSNNVMAGPAQVASGMGGSSAGPPSGTPGGGAPTSLRSSSAIGVAAQVGAGSAASAAGRSAAGPGGGMGGQLSNQVIAYLEANQGSAKYLLAATGSQTTAPIIIQTGKAVVTIGGFNGGDPAPTVTQLAKLVADGQLKYVLLSSADGVGGGFGGGGPGGFGSSSSSLSAWVKDHGTAVKAVTVTGGTLYQVG